MIDAFPKYASVKTLKDKKAKIFLDSFNKIVNESYCQPNKLWANQGTEFYNNVMQKCLHDNDILIYSTHNEGLFLGLRLNQ